MTDLHAYIPTRGRSSRCTTAALLRDAGVPFTLVVEPSEAAAYRAAFPAANLHVLPADDGGLAAARNAVLDLIRASGRERSWMLDDDISGFFAFAGGKIGRGPAERVLAEAEALYAAAGLAQGALEYQQFAWPNRQGPPLSGPGYCDVAVCLEAAALRLVRYRAALELKEDRDFTLQLLASGRRVGRSRRLAFAAPRNGSNAGGLAAAYATPGREVEACRRMAAAWGERVCRVVAKPGGRVDLKIHWRHFAEAGGR